MLRASLRQASSAIRQRAARGRGRGRHAPSRRGERKRAPSIRGGCHRPRRVRPLARCSCLRTLSFLPWRRRLSCWRRRGLLNLLPIAGLARRYCQCLRLCSTRSALIRGLSNEPLVCRDGPYFAQCEPITDRCRAGAAAQGFNSVAGSLVFLQRAVLESPAIEGLIGYLKAFISLRNREPLVMEPLCLTQLGDDLLHAVALACCYLFLHSASQS